MLSSRHIKVLLRAIIFTTLLIMFNIIYMRPTLTIFLKGRTSVRPKPGLGIGNRNQGPILVCIGIAAIFFLIRKLFLSSLRHNVQINRPLDPFLHNICLGLLYTFENSSINLLTYLYASLENNHNHSSGVLKRMRHNTEKRQFFYKVLSNIRLASILFPPLKSHPTYFTALPYHSIVLFVDNYTDRPKLPQQ